MREILARRAGRFGQINVVARHKSADQEILQPHGVFQLGKLAHQAREQLLRQNCLQGGHYSFHGGSVT